MLIAFQASSYDKIVDGFTAKFGPPDYAKADTIQNKVGGSFPQTFGGLADKRSQVDCFAIFYADDDGRGDDANDPVGWGYGCRSGFGRTTRQTRHVSVLQTTVTTTTRTSDHASQSLGLKAVSPDPRGRFNALVLTFAMHSTVDAEGVPVVDFGKIAFLSAR